MSIPHVSNNKPGFILFLVLLPLLVGCSVVLSTLEVSIHAEQDNLTSTIVLEEVEPGVRTLGRGEEDPDLLQVRRRAWREQNLDIRFGNRRTPAYPFALRCSGHHLVVINNRWSL